MDARGRFLADVEARLPLPPDVRGEVLEELAAHLADAVEDLVARGAAPEQAVAEAIANLGPPGELAREMARAHRPPGRVLVAAGAGTISAIGTGAIGVVLATFCVIVGSLLAMAVVRAVAGWLDVTTSINWTGGWNTLLTAIALNLGAVLAGAAAVRAAARAGWRTVPEVRMAVALIGVATVAWIVLIRFDQPLNWASVVALLLVPASFGVGTRFERLQLPSIRVVAVALLVGLIVSIGLGMATTTSGGGMSEPRAWNPYAGASMIAPWWQEPFNDRPPLFSGDSSAYPEFGVIDLTIETTNPAALARFHAYRLEAWRADSWDDGGSLIPGQAAPFAAAAAKPEEGWVHATLRFNRTPGVEHARLALTAVGPDGQRYLLYLSGTEETEFHGSVWNWFAALVQEAAS